MWGVRGQGCVLVLRNRSARARGSYTTSEDHNYHKSAKQQTHRYRSAWVLCHSTTLSRPVTLPCKRLHEEEEQERALAVPHHQHHLSLAPAPLISSAAAFPHPPPFSSGCPPHPDQLIPQPCCPHTHHVSPSSASSLPRVTLFLLMKIRGQG